MHQNLARALFGAGELVALEVHKAHVLGLHEAFAHQRRRADRDVFPDSDGDVATVAIDIFALPEPATNVAELFLERVRGRRVEVSFQLCLR
jgi:hypothetical protein